MIRPREWMWVEIYRRRNKVIFYLSGRGKEKEACIRFNFIEKVLVIVEKSYIIIYHYVTNYCKF